MRFRFFPQIKLGTTSIADIVVDIYSRHELTPIILALQYLYVHRMDILDSILERIAKDVCCGVCGKTGAIGMTYWEILVLAAVRLGCDKDYDELADMASQHRLIRQLMGISDWDDKLYKRSTIHENLQKITPDCLAQINRCIVSAGHDMVGQNPVQTVRGDSFVLKKNIHYPTDASLIVDGIRKINDICFRIDVNFYLGGWRQKEYLKRKAKAALWQINNTARSKRKDKNIRMVNAYKDLLDQADHMVKKADKTIEALYRDRFELQLPLTNYWKSYVSELHYFIAATEFACDLARRRVLMGETIANKDKVFSHFEPDTELINRGKRPNPIEFGHRVMVVQDMAGFIIHCEALGIGLTDEKVVVEIMKRLQEHFDNNIKAASFDKGFWTPTNLQALSEFIETVVLPKKGRLSDTDYQREHTKTFKKIRKWHPGIESAIGALGRGNALNVCRDKGYDGYARYVQLGVLGRNLQTLGTILLTKERKRRKDKDPLMSLVA